MNTNSAAENGTRGTTSKKPGSWHATMLGLTMVPSLVGCIPIKEARQNEDTLIRNYASTKRLPDTGIAATPAITLSPDGATIRMVGTREAYCEVDERHVVDRTVKVTRSTSEQGQLNGQWFWGAVGAGVLGGGLWRLSSAGASDGLGLAMVGFGGIYSVYLGAAVANSARLADSVEYLGEVDESVANRKEVCERTPAKGANVVLATSKGVAVVSATSQDDGTAELFVPAKDLSTVDAKSSITFDGKPIAAKDTIAAIVSETRLREHAAATAREAATSQQEVKTGRCTAERHEVLEDALNRIQMLFSGPRMPHIEQSEFFVATESGAPFDIRGGLVGKNHVFVVGSSRLSLEVKDSNGYPVNMGSYYEGALGTQTDRPTDSRILQAGEKYKARVKGSGCAMIFTAREF